MSGFEVLLYLPQPTPSHNVPLRARCRRVRVLQLVVPGAPPRVPAQRCLLAKVRSCSAPRKEPHGELRLASAKQ